MQKQDAGAYAREISYTLPPDTPGRYLTKGSFVFAAYGCALLERDAGKSFVYTVVNLSTGRTEALLPGRTAA